MFLGNRTDYRNIMESGKDIRYPDASTHLEFLAF